VNHIGRCTTKRWGYRVQQLSDLADLVRINTSIRLSAGSITIHESDVESLALDTQLTQTGAVDYRENGSQQNLIVRSEGFYEEMLRFQKEELRRQKASAE